MSETEEGSSQQGSSVIADKLKISRSRYAGWLTRTLSQYDSNADVPSVLRALKERISIQLSKLQAAHGKYLDVLSDDEQVDDAEEWFDGYF